MWKNQRKMYKLICANINKSRSFKISYRKLTQAKKVDQNTIKPQSEAARRTVEESQRNSPLENVKPSTAPAQTQQIAEDLTCNALRRAPHLKIRQCYRFFTGNCVIANPPTPCISKKYYHVYSITSPVGVKHYTSNTSKYFVNEEAKQNYKDAMESLRRIERKKPASVSSKTNSICSDPWVRMHSRKSSKTEVTYPTHTAKHNLTITKRYRIREGSVEGKRQTGEPSNARKNLQTKILKSKKLTYPTLFESFKEGKYNTILFNPEKVKEYVPFELDNKSQPQSENDFKPANGEESPKVAGTTLEHQEKLVGIEKDFESLIKSHPTIENASKEVKMKLKRKFIQLLLKSSTDSKQPPMKKNTVTEGKEEQLEDGLQKVANAAERSEQPNTEKEDPQTTISQPKILSKEDSQALEYSKHVLVNNVNDYDVEKVCIKENATKIGSGLISNAYAKEPPKPNYKNVDNEAQHLAKFLEKVNKIQTQNDVAVKMLKKGKESPENVVAKLEALKKEQLFLLGELQKLNITFSTDNANLDAVSTLKKETNSVESPENDSVKSKLSFTEGNEPSNIISEKLRNSSSKNDSGTVPGAVNEKKASEKVTQSGQIAELPSPTNSVAKSSKKVDHVDRKTLQEQLIEKSQTNVQDTFEKHGPKQKIILTKTRARSDGSEIIKRRKELMRERAEGFQKPSNFKAKMFDSMTAKKVTPKIRKTVAALNEKFKTEDITPKGPPVTQNVDASRKRLNKVPEQKTETSLDEPSKCDELNKIAEKLIKSSIPSTSQSKGYALEQPEIQKDIKISPKMQENDLKLEQDEKVKQDLDAFHRKKSQEWEAAEQKVLQKNPLNQKANKRKRENTVNEEGQELYSSHTKKGAGKDKNKSSNKLNAMPKVITYSAMRIQQTGGDPLPQTNVKSITRNTINTVANTEQSNLATENDDPFLTKQTQHLLDVIQTTLSKKIVSPALQESGASTVKQIGNLKKADITTDFKDYLLKEYFHCKKLPCSDQNVYMPKEKLVVNDITEIDDNKSGIKEGGEIDQKPDANVAVLRPGDEILFLEKDVNQAESENVILNVQLVEEALPVDNELQNKTLTNTDSKIDIMMEKINALENLLKINHLLLVEEKKSENKPRVVPPKPPTGKDRKDIKKDKPKGPNDMVLPPRTSISNRKPKEQKEAFIKDDTHPSNEQPKEAKETFSLHPSIESTKIVKLSQNILNQEKLENLSIKMKQSLVKSKENDDNLQANIRDETDDAHIAKIKKYFTETYGLSKKDSKEPQVDNEKNISKVNKSKSITFGKAVAKEKVVVQDKNVANSTVKLEMSASQKMVTQNKAKSFRGKLVSAPAGSSRSRKGFEVSKSLHSSSNEKSSSKAPSRPSVVKFGGIETTKTKYSSWTKQSRSGSRVNSYAEYNNIRKSMSKGLSGLRTFSPKKSVSDAPINQSSNEKRGSFIEIFVKTHDNKGSFISELNSNNQEAILETRYIQPKTIPPPKLVQSKLTSDATKPELHSLFKKPKEVIIQDSVKKNIEQEAPNPEQKNIEADQNRSSLNAFPRIYWANEKKSTSVNKVSRESKSVMETFNYLPVTDDDANAPTFLPKIIWAKRNTHTPLISAKLDTPILEMSEESLAAMPKIYWNKNESTRILDKNPQPEKVVEIPKDKYREESLLENTVNNFGNKSLMTQNGSFLEPPVSEQNTDITKKPGLEAQELCIADRNLRSDDPIATVNIVLSKQMFSKTEDNSSSGGKKLIRNVKSSIIRTKSKDQSISKFIVKDLGNDGSKISKAGKLTMHLKWTVPRPSNIPS